MTGDIVTMKVMKLFPNDEADGVPAHALREVSLLRYLRHPHIVRCVRLAQTRRLCESHAPTPITGAVASALSVSTCHRNN